MYFFYLKKGSRSQTGTFETRAAVEAGEAVRTEVRKDRPRRGQVIMYRRQPFEKCETPKTQCGSTHSCGLKKPSACRSLSHGFLQRLTTSLFPPDLDKSEGEAATQLYLPP
jgi:hypothetical protein